jgi:hypothetical protein
MYARLHGILGQLLRLAVGESCLEPLDTARYVRAVGIGALCVLKICMGSQWACSHDRLRPASRSGGSARAPVAQSVLLLVFAELALADSWMAI